jgi:hypothetical protein
MNQTLTLNVQLSDDSDPDRLDELTRTLRGDLEDLGIETASCTNPSLSAAGTKGDPVTVGTFLLALVSGGVVTTAITALKEWALRRDGRQATFEFEHDGRKFKFSFSPKDYSPEAFDTCIKDLLKVVKAC